MRLVAAERGRDGEESANGETSTARRPRVAEILSDVARVNLIVHDLRAIIVGSIRIFEARVGIDFVNHAEPLDHCAREVERRQTAVEIRGAVGNQMRVVVLETIHPALEVNQRVHHALVVGRAKVPRLTSRKAAASDGLLEL